MKQQSHVPLPSRPASSAIDPFSAEEQQWYLISEDRSLCLRILSGAIVCEGEDGELITSAEYAAHAARFDIIDDALWITGQNGRIRADGRLVSQPVRVDSGVQLHIGRTRYFIAAEINEPAPDVPLLESPMAAGDTRLPKPTQRHIPVFYSGPLDVEEIVITEAAEEPPTDPDTIDRGNKGSRASAAATPRPRQVPGRRPDTTTRTPLILLAAGVLVLSWSGWQFARHGTDEVDRDHESFTAAHAVVAGDGAHLTGAHLMNVEVDDDHDPGVLDLTHLAWAAPITAKNHTRLVARAKRLHGHIRTQIIREAIDHYARRLIRDVASAEDLDTMLKSIGPVLAPYTEYRATLAALERRVVELTRNPQRDDRGGAIPDVRVAAAPSDGSESAAPWAAPSTDGAEQGSTPQAERPRTFDPSRALALYEQGNRTP